jgi:serine protease Do
MRALLTPVSILLSVLVVSASVSFTPAQAGDDPLALFDRLQSVIVELADRIRPSVVHIEVVQKVGDMRYESLGSGLIVDSNGYILTNEHVVSDAQSVTVTLDTKEEYDAEVVGVDKQTDLALLKVEPDFPLPEAELGNSDSVLVGQWVIAVGNPYGFDRTVSFGIITGKGRVIPDLPADLPLINDFIQTDAAIDHGSSGGPLVNLRGEVVGINSIGFGRAQGFTIPINIAREVVEKLRATGEIARGWLGVVVQPFDRDMASYFQLADVGGVLVGDVIANSPAETAGLRSGDVITRFDDSPVEAANEEEINSFAMIIRSLPAGTTVPVQVYRDGEPREIEVTIATQPKVKPDEFESDIGLEVSEITENVYRTYLLPDRRGVLVTFVSVGTPAGHAELFMGDVILTVEDTEIVDLASFKSALETSADKQKLLLVVRRGRDKRFVLLKRNDHE